MLKISITKVHDMCVVKYCPESNKKKDRYEKFIIKLQKNRHRLQHKDQHSEKLMGIGIRYNFKEIIAQS